MIDLPPEIEQQLADLTDAEFSALTARLRAPDSAEQLRELAKTIVPAHALDAYMSVVDVSKYVGSDGQLDEAAARRHMGMLFGGQHNGPRSWGQHAGTPPGSAPGDQGRAEARRRAAGRGTGAVETESVSTGWSGAGGRAEARRRQGKDA